MPVRWHDLVLMDDEDERDALHDRHRRQHAVVDCGESKSPADAHPDDADALPRHALIQAALPSARRQMQLITA